MATKIIRKEDNNARELLLGLGMGNYNATIAIQYMFLSPSATDPAMPSIILMTKHLQLGLRAAGAASVPVTGQIDEPTALALIKLVGPDWNHVTWYAMFRAVSEARKYKTLLERRGADLVDLGDIPVMPSVPGGMLTWAAAAVAAWYLFFRKKH
jgi:hypothetical protein